MDKSEFENYQVEDFISDESFINYHFKSNEEDYLFWKEWIQKNPSKQDLIKEAAGMIDSLSFNLSEKEYEEELSKITSAISKENAQLRISRPYHRSSSSQSSRGRKRLLRYILPLAVILLIGGYWLMQPSGNKPETLAETANTTATPLILTLDDGTVVTLSPGSSLKYPIDFKNKERDVYLHGDAHFAVKKDVQNPFKVYTENMVATVLGTTFNIKSSTDSAIVVELLTGKLEVQITNDKMEPRQTVLLVPNERAVYVRTEKHLYKNEHVTGHDIHFRQNNFEEIAAEIKNAFGVTLINQSGHTAWRFTGDFKNSTAKDIIENICTVKKLSFVSKEDTIFIKEK